jgi:predicted transcriptional regulator
MRSKIITFEAPEDTVRAFDDVAASMSMSREEALQNLMERYLSYDNAFRASVAVGLQQADAGRLIDHKQIEARVRQWELEAEPSEQVV